MIAEFRCLLKARLGAYDEHRIVDNPVSTVDGLLSELAATDVVVATRFHNILMALLLNKPVISISFHHKCASLMGEMGLAEYCQDISRLNSDKLIEQFCELEKNAEKLKPLIKQKTEQYRRTLDGSTILSLGAYGLCNEFMSELSSVRHALAQPAVGDLKRKSVVGGVAAVSAQGAKFVLQTATTMVLARLLSPEDFGLQGMVVVVTGFLGLFRDAGLGMATIQRLEVTHEQTSTLFWINVAVGAILATLCAASGPAPGRVLPRAPLILGRGGLGNDVRVQRPGSPARRVAPAGHAIRDASKDRCVVPCGRLCGRASSWHCSVAVTGLWWVWRWPVQSSAPPPCGLLFPGSQALHGAGPASGRCSILGDWPPVTASSYSWRGTRRSCSWVAFGERTHSDCMGARSNSSLCRYNN